MTIIPSGAFRCATLAYAVHLSVSLPDGHRPEAIMIKEDEGIAEIVVATPTSQKNKREEGKKSAGTGGATVSIWEWTPGFWLA